MDTQTRHCRGVTGRPRGELTNAIPHSRISNLPIWMTFAHQADVAPHDGACIGPTVIPQISQSRSTSRCGAQQAGQESDIWGPRNRT